jgi:hypothetical protein
MQEQVKSEKLPPSILSLMFNDNNLNTPNTLFSLVSTQATTTNLETLKLLSTILLACKNHKLVITPFSTRPASINQQP